MISSLGPYPQASGPVSKVSMPFLAKSFRSDTASNPRVRSLLRSPPCPPESCQQPRMIAEGRMPRRPRTAPRGTTDPSASARVGWTQQAPASIAKCASRRVKGARMAVVSGSFPFGFLSNP
eukprot:scaffold545_cov372-Pavlova_lutheri.AAC.28